ncbi:MAG TPA: hypothetical protein VKM54_08455 [Myxococcota bacterium]|nr:hypothetical protein [Myxococcota bacterium]
MKVNDQIHGREWSKLPLYDPERVLRSLKNIPVRFIPGGRHPQWAGLRTNSLKEVRQALDATIFTFGMSQALGINARLILHEAEDFDFLVSWVDGEWSNTCPVQLKELVPDHLNPTADLNQLFAELARYPRPTDTNAAIKLNRAGKFDPNVLQIPDLPFKELWFLGSSSPDRTEWFLYRALNEPRIFEFRFPT